MVFLCYVWLVLVDIYLQKNQLVKIQCTEKVTANIKKKPKNLKNQQHYIKATVLLLVITLTPPGHG